MLVWVGALAGVVGFAVVGRPVAPTDEPVAMAPTRPVSSGAPDETVAVAVRPAARRAIVPDGGRSGIRPFVDGTAGSHPRTLGEDGIVGGLVFGTAFPDEP